MSSLAKSCRIVLKQCMNLQTYERLLIVADSKTKHIGKCFLKEGLKITQQASLSLLTLSRMRGNEPEKKIADAMLKSDVVIMATSKSLSHTKARRQASQKGVRGASMPGLTQGMLQRCIPISHRALRKNNIALIKKFGKAKNIRITTKLGTDITFSMKGRKWYDDSGLYHGKHKGQKEGKLFGNLPAGEISVGPLEGTGNGVFVIDGSIAMVGKVDKLVKVFIKKGMAYKITGWKAAKKFSRMMVPFGKKGMVLAELGIGTNPRAKITGNVLEDEKIKGTCHFALGNNMSFGGKNDVKVHIDSVIKKPTIYADGRLVLKEGRVC